MKEVVIRGLFAGIIATLLSLAPSSPKAAQLDIIDGISPGEHGILIRGSINLGDEQLFRGLADLVPDNAIVVLESPGGAVDAGLSIAAEIAIRGFATSVLDGEGCHSICAVIWVAGSRRYMNKSSDISAHAAYRLSEDRGASESGSANAKIGAFLNEIGLSYRAVEYFTAARPDQPLLKITPNVAQSIDIDVYVRDKGRLYTPHERPTPRRIIRQVSDYTGLSANCADLFGINSQFWRDQAKQQLERGRTLFGAETFSSLLGEFGRATRGDIIREGVVKWCLMAMMSLREDGLPTGINGPSYNCSRAGTPAERAICNDETLWMLDRAMSNLYFHFKRAQNNQGGKFLIEQRAWLNRRDECGSNSGCLAERYFSRLFDYGF